jgi:N-acetylglucosaminyl-diphospho-decaprenol L-rhamnosyltransferase
VDAIGHAFLGVINPDNRFSSRYKLLAWDHETARRVDWVSGACFLARRQTWEEVQGFDESFFMYMEDVDLCWRARQHGWQVSYEPGAEVTHVQGVSTDQRAYSMIVAHHRSMLKFAVRTSKGAGRLLLPVTAVGLVVRAALACGHKWRAGRGRRGDRPGVR